VAPCGMIGQKPGSLHFGSHVCDHPLDRLEGGNRLAELDSFLGVADGFIKGCLSDAQGLGGNPDSAAVQGHHGYLESLSFTAEDVFLGNTAVLEKNLSRKRSTNAHLVEVFADDKARGACRYDE